MVVFAADRPEYLSLDSATVRLPHLDRQIFLLVLIMAVQLIASLISKFYSTRTLSCTRGDG